MNYETQQFVPCDACGEEFPHHMVSNRYGDGELSKREYTISGICQFCQDVIFSSEDN